ncbi:hypothetical protein HW555_010692, partial [Spodoptera exigua]
SVQELISRQELTFNNLKQICINYKKDSPTRKNAEYLEERLSRLNTTWEKFVYNHQLLEEFEASDLQYFKDDVYSCTKKMYEDVLQDILKRKAELPTSTPSKTEMSPSASTKQGKSSAVFSFDDIKFHVPPRETTETPEKQQDLLRKQYCNFKAFERTVEKIDLAASADKWELEDNLNLLKTKWEQIEKANWELDYILQDEDSIYKQKYDAAEHLYDNIRKNLQQKIWNNAHYEKKLHDVMLECLNGLKNIGQDITNWGPLVAHLISQKLDSATHSDYMRDLKDPRGFPDLEEFTEFLEVKFMALEACQGSSSKMSFSHKPWRTIKQSYHKGEDRNNYKYNTRRSMYHNKPITPPKVFFATAKTCPICKTDHVLMKCDKFVAMNAKERDDTVRKMQVCRNCLYSHGEKQCFSRKRCRVCRKPHHTLLHYDETQQPSYHHANTITTSTLAAPSSQAVNNVTSEEKEVLLTTVQLKVKTVDGNYIQLRGLLDQGSQVSLITENAAQRLRLPRRKLSAVVSGIGSLSGWILCGNVKTFNCFVTLNNLEDMARFWETEECGDTLPELNRILDILAYLVP